VVLICFEIGAVLLYLPWSAFWEQNYFLLHYPSLIPVMLNFFVRGTVSGIGVLDIVLAARMIRRSPRATRASSQ
ncbi:MAG TPA: hypothetical protein VEJ00_12230, partial [Candidatus Acidoferrales bacterium]|nr:hypothetical protein [Candidatus Acidoferrales bacterium]